MSEHFDSASVKRDLRRTGAPSFLPVTMQRTLDEKHRVQRDVAWQRLRAHAHAVKAYAIAHLDELLVEFERQFEARGGTVLWAPTARDAVEHFAGVCARHGATSVVKGKSMVTEELELNAHLRKRGIEALETDLGEFIVQLAGQRPSHIIGPALHLSRADIGRLFQRELGSEFSDDAETLMGIARRRLRASYLAAGVGATGANFAVAETGTIVIVENEGNGGLSSSVPPVHVVVMGIEKIVPRMADLDVFLHLLARAGTGQKLTAYTHHILGAEAGKSLYCILVDAGRTRVLADPQSRESLYCIRCGACMNVCPVYRRVGGWAYGSAYMGPIGAALTPKLVGVERAAEPAFASSLCGACQEECPVDIDLPHQLVHVRNLAVESGGSGSRGERLAMDAWADAMSSARKYRRATRAAKIVASVAGALPWKPGLLGAWARHRRLPAFARQSFHAWWRDRW